MTEIERLVERAVKDLADLRRVIERLQAILAEYADTVDALARERENAEWWAANHRAVNASIKTALARPPKGEKP